MLVLSRRLDEKIIVTIDGKTVLEITIADIQKGKVRLSFVADGNVKIWREEIADKLYLTGDQS